MVKTPLPVSCHDAGRRAIGASTKTSLPCAGGRMALPASGPRQRDRRRGHDDGGPARACGDGDEGGGGRGEGGYVEDGGPGQHAVSQVDFAARGPPRLSRGGWWPGRARRRRRG